MVNFLKKLKKTFFGISPIIASLMLVLVVVASVAAFQIFIHGWQSNVEVKDPDFFKYNDSSYDEEPDIDIPPYVNLNPTKIVNSKGKVWQASSENIQEAINDLGALGGDVWLPPGEYELYENLEIQTDDTRLHGAGDSTLIKLFNDAKIYSNDNDNILLENFNVTGSGKIWLVLGENTVVRNINAYNITAPWDRAFTFFNFKLPHYQDRSGLYVDNCHVNRCTLSGFMIYAEVPGSTLSDVNFDNCTANWCGWDVNGVSQQSPWSVGFVFNECKNHPDFHIKDLTVRNCVANYNWESGFHFEYVQTQENCRFYDCQANYNGQKLNYVSELPDEYFCSGFLNIKTGISCYNCEAIGNTAYGFQTVGGNLHDCVAYDNTMGDFS